MRVWIDGQCFQTASRFRGIGRYAIELLRAINEHHPEVRLSISFNAAMPETALHAADVFSECVDRSEIRFWQGACRLGENRTGRSPRRRVSELSLAYHVEAIAPDIALSTSPFEGADDCAVPYHPFKRPSFVTSAIFYDAIPWRFPALYLPETRLKRSYRRRLDRLAEFDVVLAISDFARREADALVKGCQSVNISAGVSSHFLHAVDQGEDDVASERSLPDVLLYVGGLDVRKNVPGVIEAFGLLEPSVRNRACFWIVGEPNPGIEADLRQRWSVQGLADANLRILGHVSDQRLIELYQTVGAVIQPSFMEGFGLTALEAMSLGAPVIAANNSGLREVVQAEDALFDVGRLPDMARKIEHVLSDRDFSRALGHAGRERARAFTWKKSAATAVDAWSHAASRSSRRSVPTDRADVFAKAVRSSGWANQQAAEVMAASVTSPLNHTPRLFIDTTATCRADHGTGIQRVVNKITRGLLALEIGADQPKPVPVYSDSTEGFFRVKIVDDKLALASKTDADRIEFRRGDTLLMLDSSWEFYAAHQHQATALRINGVRIVSVLYDQSPLIASGFAHSGMPPIFSQWFLAALGYSDAIVCISRAIADELVDTLTSIQYPRSIDVEHWPLGADFKSDRAASPDPEPDEMDTFLMVGTIEPRKGYQVALDAFDRLWKARRKVRLVLVGRKGWNVDALIERIERHPEFGERLIWRSNASDSDLMAWYQQADALITTSFYEGFGLPIVEAAHFGKPVIASDLPVFREVAQSAEEAVFFEAGSATALAGAINQFRRGRREESSLDALARVAWPSWRESATDLYRKLENRTAYVRYRPDPGVLTLGHAAPTTAPPAVALTEADRANRITVVSQPSFSSEDDAIEFVLRVDNAGSQLWSSVGELPSGKHAVRLGRRHLNASGDVLFESPERTTIPFIIKPSGSAYLRVSVPTHELHAETTTIEVELVEELVAWMGGAVAVSIVNCDRVSIDETRQSVLIEG